MKSRSVFSLLILIALFIIADKAFAVNNSNNSTDGVPIGSWVANLNGVGNIALHCFSNGNSALCELFWVFSKIKVTIEVGNDDLTVYQKENKNNYFVVSTKNGNPYKFKPLGILVSNYAYYADFEFQSISNGKYADITAWNRKGSDYSRYYERGILKPLPDHLPGWLMNPSAYLFLAEKVGATVGLGRILEHKSLTSETLKEICIYFSEDSNYSDYYLRIIASNPSTSIETLDALFKAEVSKNSNTAVLNAIASNPVIQGKYKKKFFDMVKSGSSKLQENIVRDHDAPPELLDWIAKNGEISFGRSPLYSNKNVWPETLDYLSDKYTHFDAIRSMLNNKNINDNTMLKLASRDYSDKFHRDSIMISIIRHTDRNNKAIDLALEKLSESKTQNSKIEVIRDNRISRSLIDKFLKSEEIFLRSTLADNKSLKYEDLVMLANDPYLSVSKKARIQLKKRYFEQYKNLESSLPPLTSLNPAISLLDELDLAVKQKNIPYIKQVMLKIKRNETPLYHVKLETVFNTNSKEIVDIIFEGNNYQFKQIIKIKEFNADWLKYLLYKNYIQYDSQYKTLAECVELRRLDYLKILIDSGLDINSLDVNSGRNLLFLAIQIQDDEFLDYLVDNGIDFMVREKVSGFTPLSLAKRVNYIYAINKLGKAEYGNYLTRQQSEFTPRQNSKIIGIWSNNQEGFKAVTLTLKADGSGSMVSPVMATAINWKEINGSQLLFTPIIEGKMDRENDSILYYKIEEGNLFIGQNSESSTKYYRKY